MASLPRRALLATVAAGSLGSVAGCTDRLVNYQADGGRSSPIAGRTIFVADGNRLTAEFDGSCWATWYLQS